MTEPVKIIGNYLSPYVRKVLAILHLKGLAYRIDPIVPFYGDEAFGALSPLRRIPVLIDDRVTLADSSVICQYLEDRHPDPPLYPADVADRARARWLEEYADTRIGDVFIWRIYNQLVIRRFVWNQPVDQPLVERTLAEDVPEVVDYLERWAPEQGFLFGALSIADISVASFFRNAALARVTVDAARWPRTAAFVERVLAEECFQHLTPFERISAKTPIPQQREALAAAGAPVTAETHFTSTPRKGPMSV